MRRADRLFQIIQLLRRRRGATTAKWLANELEVSERTIYRDIRDLAGHGTPIEGEAGVGYTLRAGYDLPPLMFDEEEIEALVLGARVAQAFGDEALAKAAARALSKVETALPKRLRPRLSEAALFVPRLDVDRAAGPLLARVRGALSARHKLRFTYERPDGDVTTRTVRPLGAFLWGQRWSITAWCEMREAFRNFRLDRMRDLEVLDAPFVDEPGKTLRDFLASVGPEASSILER